jgi:hypothetical protein
MPLCHVKGKTPDRETAEMGYFKSVAELCQIHGLQPLEVGHLPYPYNVLLSHRDLSKKLNRLPYDTELLIAKCEQDKTIALATKQVYEVGNTLYFIPVIPLFRFMRHKENKACGTLLLAVLSYLYREAGIPYYRDEDNFINGEYEMNKEYFLECLSENPDDYEEDMSDIVRNDICGDIMQRRIHNRYHLDNFARTIDRFKPRNPFEEECLLIAKDAFALYQEFPNRSVFQNIPDPDDWDEVATPESYVAFIGDGKGWVYENIERYVNDYLGNFSEMALPVCTQVFNGTATAPQTLEFENRLFDLITDLCNILFDLK